MSDRPVFFFKYLRLGDAREKGETIEMPIGALSSQSGGENERRSLHANGANASFVIKFTEYWQRGAWNSAESHVQFSSRIRKDFVRFREAMQQKIDQRRREGPLCYVANDETDSSVTIDPITGSGSPESIGLDEDVAFEIGDWALVIDTDGTTHELVQSTAASTSTFTAAFSRAYAAGAWIIKVEWWLPYAWPIQQPRFERDDSAQIVRCSFAFEGSDDPIDNLTEYGPTIP